MGSGAGLPSQPAFHTFRAMRMSQYFLPTMKENPSEAQIVSHRLMLRAGLIRQTSAGIYAWLPLGFRVLKNIERIVRRSEEHTSELQSQFHLVCRLLLEKKRGSTRSIIWSDP